MLPRFVLLAALVFIASCDGSAHERPALAWMQDLYEARHAMVLESPDHGPELCVGVVLLPDPPRCGGPPIVGWSWDEVEGESTTGGTTWGEYHVTGAFDGEVFTLVDVGPPRDAEPEPETSDQPCTEPANGWAVPDPKKASEWHTDRASERASDDDDFAGIWQDYYGDGEIILYVAFTGDLERHERDLRKAWGGALCLVERDLTYAELDAMREEASKVVERDFGLQTLGSWTEESEGRVGVRVISIDDAARAELYDRFPEGMVYVETELTPVE